MKKKILKNFLFLLALLLIGVGCKKQQIEEPLVNSNGSAFNSRYVLIKQNTEFGGGICDVYKNIITGNKVYVVKKELNTKLNYNLSFNSLMGNCDKSGNNCTEATVDGEAVWVIKKKDRK